MENKDFPFRKKWYSKASSLKENPTYQDKREACEILGVQAIVYPVDPTKEKPRYRFRMLLPEIEHGNPLHRAKHKLPDVGAVLRACPVQ